jgi:methylated-DNA-[protein]-cysteine S-methyltransferase
MVSKKSTSRSAMPRLYIGCAEATPLGDVWLALSEDGLAAVGIQSTRLAFEESLRRDWHPAEPEIVFNAQRTASATQQVCEYLAGERRNFDLAVDWSVMGDFQQRALQATTAIPFGETRTYAQIATGLGQPGAARAVGRAEATNPMPLVVPCHRVLGADGKLHGYSAPGGLKTKAWLLELESRS